MLSFIVPAHNEEQYIGSVVDAIVDAGRGCGEPFEVIVVDDASTDRTAAIAAERGARVIHVQHRQIAATRNAGARESHGEILFFVDGDTIANAHAVRACLAELHQGAVGGGCVFTFDGTLPRWARLLYPVAVMLARRLSLVGGAFLFCTRDAFEKTGGFCERYYAAEEEAFIRSLKKIGRFAIPRPTVITSGRKLRGHSAWQIIREVGRWMLRGPESYQSRHGLDLWYGQRVPDSHVPSLQTKT